MQTRLFLRDRPCSATPAGRESVACDKSARSAARARVWGIAKLRPSAPRVASRAPKTKPTEVSSFRFSAAASPAYAYAYAYAPLRLAPAIAVNPSNFGDLC